MYEANRPMDKLSTDLRVVPSHFFMPIGVGNGMDDMFLIQVRWCRFEKRLGKRKHEKGCAWGDRHETLLGGLFPGGLLFWLAFSLMVLCAASVPL